MKAADVERAAELLAWRAKLREMVKLIGSKAGSAKPGIVLHGDYCGCETGDDIDNALRIPAADAVEYLALIASAVERQLDLLGVET
jgi:hypothetical protein